MSPERRSLFPSPRTQGPHERALATVRRAWKARSHLQAPEDAAHLVILRELARLADSAVAAQANHDISQYAAAIVVDRFRLALDQYAPVADVPADPTLTRLDAAALTIVTTGTDDEW